MSFAIRLSLCNAAVVSLSLISVAADEPKSDNKGGIQGKVIKVDTYNRSLTIGIEGARDRTFSVTDETSIVGPRGGLVHKRLNDPRFHVGLPITIVASGGTATEVHLGYDRKTGATATTTSQPASNAPTVEPVTPSTVPGQTKRTAKFRPAQTATAPANKAVRAEEADDDDNEYPGKVKSVDSARRLLVITLMNGKDRSFMLASDVKVTVHGRVSKLGLSDAAIKPGIPLTVITEAGGRKVKEVKVSPMVGRTTRKAG